MQKCDMRVRESMGQAILNHDRPVWVSCVVPLRLDHRLLKGCFRWMSRFSPRASEFCQEVLACQVQAMRVWNPGVHGRVGEMMWVNLRRMESLKVPGVLQHSVWRHLVYLDHWKACWMLDFPKMGCCWGEEAGL